MQLLYLCSIDLCVYIYGVIIILYTNRMDNKAMTETQLMTLIRQEVAVFGQTREMLATKLFSGFSTAVV